MGRPSGPPTKPYGLRVPLDVAAEIDRQAREASTAPTPFLTERVVALFAAGAEPVAAVKRTRRAPRVAPPDDRVLRADRALVAVGYSCHDDEATRLERLGEALALMDADRSAAVQESIDAAAGQPCTHPSAARRRIGGMRSAEECGACHARL